MRKWPSSNGLPISPYEVFRVPTAEDLSARRRTTNHHELWPHAAYMDGIQRVFRALETNVQPLLIEEHTELHNEFGPPVMPKTWLMIDVIDEYAALNGVLNLVYEKRTQQTYQMELQQWERIRG